MIAQRHCCALATTVVGQVSPDDKKNLQMECCNGVVHGFIWSNVLFVLVVYLFP